MVNLFNLDDIRTIPLNPPFGDPLGKPYQRGTLIIECINHVQKLSNCSIALDHRLGLETGFLLQI